MVSPPPVDFGGLVRSLGEATSEMEGLKTQLVNANRRSAAAKNVAMIGVVAAAVGVAIGAGGLLYADNAQETAETVAQIQDDILADRFNVRVASCIQANVTTKKVRDALVSGVESLTPRDGTVEQKARAEEFIGRYTAQVEKVLGYRDCTPTGIAAYFEHPPGDPAKEG